MSQVKATSSAAATPSKCFRQLAIVDSAGPSSPLSFSTCSSASSSLSVESEGIVAYLVYKSKVITLYSNQVDKGVIVSVDDQC